MGAFKMNRRGTGSAQYHPRMMLALLIYCYANGIFSSRRIERATRRDIGVRFVAANSHPDHDCCSARELRADRRDKLLKWLDTGGHNCAPSNKQRKERAAGACGRSANDLELCRDPTCRWADSYRGRPGATPCLAARSFSHCVWWVCSRRAEEAAAPLRTLVVPARQPRERPARRLNAQAILSWLPSSNSTTGCILVPTLRRRAAPRSSRAGMARSRSPTASPTMASKPKNCTHTSRPTPDYSPTNITLTATRGVSARTLLSFAWPKARRRT